MDAPLIKVIALDLGTTSIKAALMDEHGQLHSFISQPAPKITTDQGHYESDALCYVETAEQVLQQCYTKTKNNPPLGLCSQRSSFLIWEKSNGQPITPLISWQDNRGISRCESLHANEPTIRQLTGLRLTPYYFAPKLSVLLQEHPSWRNKLTQGEWLIGTLDTFMIWRWTHGKQHIMDASMAARSSLMDIHQQQWSPVLCDLFKIPLPILPQIRPSTGLDIALDNGMTLNASVGDQSAALIACVTNKPTKALVNLGTGGFVIRYLTTQKKTQDGYLRTLIYQDDKHQTYTAIEGTLNSIAAALAPYPVKECRIEHLATTDIFCLAEPSGLGAPYFRDDWGLFFSQPTNQLTPLQITALLLEAIIFRVVRILEEFHQDSPITQAYLSGGLSELDCLQHGISQCTPFPVLHLKQKETSLQGAALLASGLKTKHIHHAEIIKAHSNNDALIEKYHHWQDWLDALILDDA